MNRQAAVSGSATSITSLNDLVGIAGRTTSTLPGESIYERYVGSSIRTPEPQSFPKRVYRIILSRGVQEVTCTSVATDEGFLKFYDTMVINNQVHTSVVAMYPATSVQQVTSVLESEAIVV